MNFNPKPFYLGRISGIPIQAHYSWLPVFPIYAWVISQVLLPRNVPGRPIWEYWILGIVTTTLLFASVLIHELAHSIMARIEGVGTGGITLYLFRSEEHTSELQSHLNLVCRLLLEKKKINIIVTTRETKSHVR